MTGRLDGRVALITGAARGQGAAEAELFVAEGARVVLTDVDAEGGEALADRLGAAARFEPLDVRDEARWTAVVASATDAFGPPTILVNNAGVMPVGRIEDAPLDQVRNVLDVNLIGALLGIRAVAPAMRAAGGGSIVNISSIAGLQGTRGMSAYSMSKFGLRGLSRSAASELGHDGIRVNSVHPGPIETDMVAAFFQPDSLRDRPVPRWGRPDEVAKVVLFLASDDVVLRDRRGVRRRRRRAERDLRGDRSGRRRRPCDLRLPHCCAPRQTAIVGEGEPGFERPAGLIGRPHGFRIHRREHELGPAKHGEAPQVVARVDVPPGEIDEPVTGSALDARPPEVGRAGAIHDGDLGGEHGQLVVCGHDLVGLALPLDADVHVAVIATAPARQVGADDPQDHDQPQGWGWSSGRSCASVPPSTKRTEPQKNRASGPRRKATKAASSSAVPLRPTGIGNESTN